MQVNKRLHIHKYSLHDFAAHELMHFCYEFPLRYADTTPGKEDPRGLAGIGAVAKVQERFYGFARRHNSSEDYLVCEILP